MSTSRRQLLQTASAMVAAGLNKGTAGNLSVRVRADDGDQEATDGGFLITPSGMRYDLLSPEDLVFMQVDGRRRGSRQPSSEWRFHRDIYATRADAGAILHAHSPFATSLACLRREVPPFHYMIARFGGDSVRCADYATFGTPELAAAIVRALHQRQACLLANHGMLVLGDDLEHVLALAIELEALCEQYWRACAIGQPVLLQPAEMAMALAQFASYGRQC